MHGCVSSGTPSTTITARTTMISTTSNSTTTITSAIQY